MNLIIEAGGTKSNLVFVDNGNIVASYTDPGLHLSRESIGDFQKKIQRWGEFQTTKLTSVFLFAAGKISLERAEELKQIIASNLDLEISSIYLESDLLAACYASAGNKPGVVGILGTGSNSCYYDGESIVKNVAPGGFILGDEGSGSHIGKLVLLDYLRKCIPADIRKMMEEEIGLNDDIIISNIYQGTMKDAVNFCSGLASFVIPRMKHEYFYEVCKRSINQYLQVISTNYLDRSNQLFLVGSIAFYLQEVIKEEAEKMNIEIIKIIQHPVNDLAIFLTSKHHL